MMTGGPAEIWTEYLHIVSIERYCYGGALSNDAVWMHS
jgi:hypothetical protein